MIKSLFIKLGMLAVTIEVVLWLGWVRQPSIQPLSIPMQGEATDFFKRSNYSEQGHGGTPQALLKVAQLHKPALLDLNRASADELETLPGIGAVLAQRVIAFRESAGRFRTVEDLRGVKGIGAKKFDRLKSLVTVSTRETQRETERRAS
jgi:competence protein ComEA